MLAPSLERTSGFNLPESSQLSPFVSMSLPETDTENDAKDAIPSAGTETTEVGASVEGGPGESKDERVPVVPRRPPSRRTTPLPVPVPVRRPTPDPSELTVSDEGDEDFAPLLGGSPRLPGNNNNGTISAKDSRPRVADELKGLLRFGIPISSGYLLSYLSQVTCIFFIGHLGSLELAAACLAITFANVSGFSIGIGLATASDTLGAQAFTGRTDDPTAVGRILQQALVVMLFASIPMALLWIFAGPLLLSLGQDPEVVALTSNFLRLLLPALYPTLAFECLKRFLQAQGIVSAYSVVIAATTLANIPLTYILIWSDHGFGINGAPIAIGIIAWTNLLLMLLYAKLVNGAQGWGGFSRDAVSWKEIRGYLRLAIPATMQIAFEWWSFEALALLAGLLGSEPLAAQSVITTITSLVFMIPLGLGVSTTTRVAQYLGSGRAAASQLSSWCGLGLALAFGGIVCAVLLIFRNSLGALLTSDKEVITLVAAILPIAAVYELLDSVNCVAAGVLRGCASTGYSAAASFIGYYVVGIPLSGFLTLGPPNLGLQGIWIGITAGLGLSVVVQLVVIGGISYEDEAVRTRRRLHLQQNDLTFSPALGATIGVRTASSTSLPYHLVRTTSALFADLDAALIAADVSDPGDRPFPVPVPYDRPMDRLLRGRRFANSPLTSPSVVGFGSAQGLVD